MVRVTSLSWLLTSPQILQPVQNTSFTHTYVHTLSMHHFHHEEIEKRIAEEMERAKSQWNTLVHKHFKLPFSIYRRLKSTAWLVLYVRKKYELLRLPGNLQTIWYSQWKTVTVSILRTYFTGQLRGKHLAFWLWMMPCSTWKIQTAASGL